MQFLLEAARGTKSCKLHLYKCIFTANKSIHGINLMGLKELKLEIRKQRKTGENRHTLAHLGLMSFINQTSLVDFCLFRLHMLHQAHPQSPGNVLDREDSEM